MIEIDAVLPTPKEFRVIKRGWGAIHWLYMIPLLAYPVGFIVFGFLAVGRAGSTIPTNLFPISLIATTFVWSIGSLLVQRAAVKAQQMSPTGNLPWHWRIDAEGFVFDNGLQRNQLDWRGVRAVREEKDRFLFLVTPSYNPVLPLRLLPKTSVWNCAR